MDRNAMIAMLLASQQQPQPTQRRGCVGCSVPAIVIMIIVIIMIWLPWEAIIK
jgi:hypothetical protein